MNTNFELSSANHSVQIDAGELVSYQVSGHEFMHQKGNAGWRNVDTEMFPIIGPTNEADFKVKTPRGNAIQDQHGLLREMNYKLLGKTEKTAVFKKRYTANATVLNSKYPNKSFEEKLSWPYDFEFEKKFELQADNLQITFTITGEERMPFMIGYHPAFRLQTESASIVTDKYKISIPEVMAVGSRALLVPDTTTIQLNDKRSLQMVTEGFKHFMLWTEVPNMVCIEPITFYPYAFAQQRLAEGFLSLKNNPMVFTLRLQPM